MRRVGKWIAYVFSLLLLFAIGAVAYIIIQKDVLIQQGVAQANAYLAAPVKVRKIDLNLWAGFPRVRIALHDVRIKDPQDTTQYLLESQEVSLGMNLWAVIQGDYEVEELFVSGGQLNLVSGALGDNWSMLWKEESATQSKLQLRALKFEQLHIHYRDVEERLNASGTVISAQATGILDAQSKLAVNTDIQNIIISSKGNVWAQKATVQGSVNFNWEDNSWNIQSQELWIGESSLALDLTQNGGLVQGANLQLQKLSRVLPIIDLGDFSDWNLPVSLGWKGQWENWELQFGWDMANGTYDSFRILETSGAGLLQWSPASRRLEVSSFNVKSQTGSATGQITVAGKRPRLVMKLDGQISLNELGAYVPKESMESLGGSCVVEDLVFVQEFDSWESFNSIGSPQFSGWTSLDGAFFTIPRSNVKFDQISGRIKMNNDEFRLDQLFIRNGANNALLDGYVRNAFGDRPKITVRMETAELLVDSLLLWEFEGEDGDSVANFDFDFQLDLNASRLTMGSFTGESLSGTVFNQNHKILGTNFFLNSCAGSFSGNWALADDPRGSRFWSHLSAQNIRTEQFLASFNSFDIEDLDASNLMGQATADADISLFMDRDWEAITDLTRIDGTIKLENGMLKHYAPLQELSSFVDQRELEQITFPNLVTTFHVRGDTLFLPETEVRNSALNLTVNGWQNLESDDIEYSVRLGIKDLALRGKNSNRDLGAWVQEAENENQPYIRLLVGCNLDDPCISLDKERIKSNLKATLKHEKEDLKSVFKKQEDTSNPSSGQFELLWPEDTLQ